MWSSVARTLFWTRFEFKPTALLTMQLVPLLMIWFGVFPVAISHELALAATLYIVSTFLILYRVRTWR